MRILIIEDSKRLRESIARGLRAEGYAVDEVGDGRQGLIYAQAADYDLVILDLMLPELDGLSLLETLRERGSAMNVLILSAKDTVEDRVRGLRTGADDYLVKPFSFDELLARIEAIARREHGQKRPILEIGALRIDPAAKSASVGDAALDLTRRELALLEYLAMNCGRPVPRMELEEHLYDAQSQPWSNAIDSAVSALRRKLRSAGLDDVIRTRRGLGYCIDRVESGATVNEDE